MSWELVRHIHERLKRNLARLILLAVSIIDRAGRTGCGLTPYWLEALRIEPFDTLISKISESLNTCHTLYNITLHDSVLIERGKEREREGLAVSDDS